MKPWRSEPWCIGAITGASLWHMEDVLHQDERPYDPRYPLICFDERPWFLIEDIGGIMPMSPGKAKRSHYEYGKNGSCCVLLAFEPQTGFRYVEVRNRRTALDDVEFLQHLLALYPDALAIRLVQDHLNTHTPGAFYEVVAPHQAFEQGPRFDLHDTPKKGRWLNMADIELAALVKPCLDRRIPDIDRLTTEVRAWAQERNRKRTTVKWTFAKHDARQKLERHYSNAKKLI